MIEKKRYLLGFLLLLLQIYLCGTSIQTSSLIKNAIFLCTYTYVLSIPPFLV